MKKSQAVTLFGSVGDLAKALGITPQAIYQWPDDLPQRTADEVIGAAVRLGKLPSAPWPRGGEGRASAAA